MLIRYFRGLCVLVGHVTPGTSVCRGTMFLWLVHYCLYLVDEGYQVSTAHVAHTTLIHRTHNFHCSILVNLGRRRILSTI